MPLAVNDILEFKRYCFLNNQVSVNTMHYRITAITPGTLIQDIVDAYDATEAPLVRPMLVVDATYRGVSGQKIRGATENLALSVANTGVGTGGVVPLPSQTCGIVTKRSLQAGRSGRGRMYWPFPATVDCDPATGQPVALYISGLDAWATASIAITIGFLTVPGFGMRAVLKQSLVADYTLWPELASWTSQLKWATQRRRGAYGRLNALPF